MQTGHARSHPRPWLWTLLALVLIGTVLASLNGDFLTRVWQERDMIASGHRIRTAIGAYYEASPGTAKTYPSALQHLLMDPRMLGEQKYLDFQPTDPIARKPVGVVAVVTQTKNATTTTTNTKYCTKTTWAPPWW